MLKIFERYEVNDYFISTARSGSASAKTKTGTRSHLLAAFRHPHTMQTVVSSLLLLGIVASTLASSNLVLHGHNSVSSAAQAHSIGNTTIAGTDKGCKHRSQYFVNPNTKFQMCTGQTDQDLKNGMSIINLINSRGFLPTCRVMQLMLWMAGTVNDKGYVGRELFVDVGANIGMIIHCRSHLYSASNGNTHLSYRIMFSAHGSIGLPSRIS